MGRSTTRRHGCAAVGHDQIRHSVLERTRHRIRVLELRLRDPRSHRAKRERHAVCALHPATRAPPARHDVHHDGGARRTGQSLGARLPPAGRRVARGSGATRRLVRRDGRHAHEQRRPVTLGRTHARRLAGARWRRVAGTQAFVVARDAADRALQRRFGRAKRRRCAVTECRWLRLRPSLGVELSVRAYRVALRRPAGFRLADALAPRIWCRHRGARQPYVHRLDGRDRSVVRDPRQERRAQAARAAAGARAASHAEPSHATGAGVEAAAR